MAATAQSSPPPTSATVLEFICLFTRDLRRKQKRWQDGRLKYHTFNNRVMVYDDRGNFVGDMHWRHDWDLEEGEEVELERGGSIVQVQELSSRCEQDLSDLLYKRAKEKEQRQMQAVARSPGPSALPRTAVRPVVPRPIPTDQTQIRHRSLHQVIGTPSGHHGRALVPKDSPFDQRQQNAESPDERAAKRRKYDIPPPSKSGYASALFGQALTLSATPISSVPVAKRRVARERDLNSEDEDIATEVVRDEPQPPLREQPKASRHFNRPSKQSRSIDTSKNTMSSPCVVKDAEESRGKHKQDRSLLRREQVQLPSSAGDECTEAYSSSTNAMEEPTHPATAEERSAKHPEARKNRHPKPAASPSRQLPGPSRTRRDQFNDVSDKEAEAPENISETQGRLEGSKKLKPKTKMPKPAVKKAMAVSSAMKNDDETKAVTFRRRDPSVPVTELRIKSRKKCGLMMISGLPAKAKAVEETDYLFHSPARPHEELQPLESSRKGRSTKSTELRELDGNFRSTSPEARAESGAEEVNRGGPIQRHEEDGLFRSPTLPPHTRTGTTQSRHDDNTMAQRRISEELGEDDDLFQVPSFPVPVAPAETTANHGAEARVGDMDLMELTRGEDSGALQMGFSDMAAKPVEDTQNVTSTSPPQAKIYDPYRLPSSSLEEISELPPRVASGLTVRSSPRLDRIKSPALKAEAQQSVDKAKKTGKPTRLAKRRLEFLRNVENNEDEEMDVLYGTPERVEHGVAEALGLDSELNIAAREKQGRSVKATERKLKLQGTLDEDDETDSSTVSLVKQAKPRQVAKAEKKSLKPQDQESFRQLEDEQLVNRQKAAHKPRTRATEYEETPSPSGQEDYAEESSSKRLRKAKTDKPSKNRPRLEKIKKSVKSRELIGFNLSALDGPLGFQGIEMPFNVLSSPANEPIQTKNDDHAAIAQPSDSRLPSAASDVPPTIIGADEIAVCAHSLADARCNLSTESAGRPAVQAATTGGDEIIWPDCSKRCHSLGSTDHGPYTTAMKVSVSGQTMQDLPRPQQATFSGASQPRELPALLVPHGDKPRNETTPMDVTLQSATSEIPRQSERQVLPMSTVPTANGAAQEASPTLQRQTSAASRAAGLVPLVPDHPGEPTESTGSDEPNSMINGAVAKPFVPPPNEPLVAKQDPKLSKVTAITSEEVPTENAVEAIIETRPLEARKLPAFKRPEHKATSALTRQLSHIANVSTDVDRPHSDIEENASETVAEDTPGPFGQSESKPPPALRRQAPTFKPPVLARSSSNPGDNARLSPQSNYPLADVGNSGPNDLQPARQSRALARSNSSVTQAAKVITASSGADAKESTRSQPELTLPVQRPECTSLQRTASAMRRINNFTTKPLQLATIDEPVPAHSISKSTSNGRIVNPASRGRKAAVKSDAKGRVPQRMLPPTQPFAMAPIDTHDFLSTPIEEPPKEPERPKKKMTFPGFQSARAEGPWSREAFDLLESGRPE